MTLTKQPLMLSGRGGRQSRRQWFTGQRAALAQVVGFLDALVGVASGDAQPVGQHMGELAADLRRGGLLVHLVDQRMARHRQPAHVVFEALQQCQSLRCGQRIERQVSQTGDRVAKRVELGDDLLATADCHTRILSATTDKKPLKQQ